MNPKAEILIVDDERHTREALMRYLEIFGAAALAVVALASFLILARVAPDFIDSLLYTPEQLRIINY